MSFVFLGHEAISQSNGMLICRGCKIYLQLLLSIKTNKQTNKLCHFKFQQEQKHLPSPLLHIIQNANEYIIKKNPPSH